MKRLSLSRTFAMSLRSGIAASALLVGGGAAFAQEAEDEAGDDKEIIVTGTLVRGVAPPGASPIAVDQKKIQETGATTVAQVLQTIPQLANFGQIQAPTSSTPETTVNRPNLRNLPGFTTSGGSSTLVLLDGHRIVGMGSNTTSPDPDFIPPGVLQRIEIVPDGGSAVYGSDAVAGVINFITISRFDGVKVDASYGFADDYFRWDANITAGKDWGSGSIFASYNYAKGDDLLGIDRDYVRQFPGADGRTEIQCSPGNVQASGVFHAQPGTTANTLNQCDGSDFQSLYPAYERHSVFAGLTQQLSDAIKIDIRAFYTKRDTDIKSGPFRFSTQLSAAQARAPYVALGAQTVFGSFGANNANHLDIGLETWGVTPTITADLGGNWQLRVLGSHGESLATRSAPVLDNTALTNLVASGAFNPYAPSTASQSVIDQLTGMQNFGRTRQYMDNVRVVLDGDLFELPAGAVKIAVGGEYSKEQFVAQNGTANRGFPNGGFTPNGINTVQPRIPVYNLDRKIKSVFGEMVLPIIGGEGGPDLTLSVAGRYDDYSDVGDTFNPRFGLTFKPVEWFAIRGAWGKSFNAPSLADDARAASSDVFFLPSVATGGFRPPADLVANNTYPAYPVGNFVGGILAIRGNKPGIQPQTSKNWTVGFDLDPPFIPGLTFGATYYNLDFQNYIGLPNFGNSDDLYRNYGTVIQTRGITQAQLDAIIVQDTDGIIAPFGSTCPFGGFFGCATAAGTYAIFDARKQNVGSVKITGLDFRMNYRTETGFGAIFLNSAGTYDLSRKEKTVSSPFRSVLGKDNNRLRVRSTLGAEIGSFLGQVTWTHRGGYDFTTPRGFIGTTPTGQVFPGQASAASFNTFDIFFKYDVPSDSGIAKDLSFTLNVENAFDQDPPVFSNASTSGVAPGFTNGSTIGRFIKFGVSKKF